MISPTNLSIGIDIQLARGCPYAILDAAGEPVAAGWLPGQDVAAAAASLDRALAQLAAGRPTQVAIGIDAPRCFLPAPARGTGRGTAGALPPAATAAPVATARW